MAGPITAVGFDAPPLRNKTNPVVEINVSALVFSTRNVHMALVAVPGQGFSFSSCVMARNPKGVAALPAPIKLAAIFIIIAPIAG